MSGPTIANLYRCLRNETSIGYPGKMDIMRTRKMSLVAVLATGLFAAGCQSGPATTSVRYDNVRFMDIWGTYTHCLSSDEAQAAMLDSSKLQQVSQIRTHPSPLEDLFPTKLKNRVAQPASRLAVDIHAMAAACSLHAGDLAISVGEHDLARNQFRQILSSHTQSDYSYYAAQARERLSNLESTLQAALH